MFLPMLQSLIGGCRHGTYDYGRKMSLSYIRILILFLLYGRYFGSGTKEYHRTRQGI
jgi:hypothetical protein